MRDVKKLWKKLADGKDIELENPRESGDTLVNILYKGNLLFTPRISHGKKDVDLLLLMRDYKLNKEEMLNFINCPFSTDDWIDRLKEKKLI